MPSDLITKRQRYESLRTTLWSERSSFDATWRDLAQYLFPVRARFTLSDRNRGDRRNQQIVDSTATFSSNTLRSGLHAGLTSPARPWMKLSTPDPSLAKYGPVKQWLHQVTERMHIVFQLSNLYNALPIVYGDMGIFGTAAVGVLDDPGSAGRPGDLMRCYPYPIGTYALGMDNRGLVTTFVREYVKTVGQLVEEFGGRDGRPLQAREEPDWSRFSDQIKKLWDDHKYEESVNVTWIVAPNREQDTNRLDYRAFPWSSCHYEKDRGDGVALRESGFEEFPVLAPRWFANAEDTYGTDCPGLTCLGDVKQLQIQQKRKGQAIEKLINPPLVGPSHLRTQKVSLIPGDTTYSDDRDGMRGLRPIHEVKPDVQHLVVDIEDTRRRIERAFFVDLIMMLGYSDPMRGSQPITAREVDERHEEKLMQLGPVLESTIDELLDPLIDRVYGQMDRAGLIPEPPDELQGVSLKVEYISIMAQAQKLLGIAPLERLLQTLIAAQPLAPQLLAKVDLNAFMDEFGDKLGVNPALLRSTEDAQALLQQQEQAAQQQAAADTMQRLARGAKDLGTTPMGGDTALTRILEGAAAA